MAITPEQQRYFDEHFGNFDFNSPTFEKALDNLERQTPAMFRKEAAQTRKKEQETELMRKKPWLYRGLNTAAKGFEKAGSFLFGNVGKFVGGATGVAGELGALATSKPAREVLMRGNPEEFNQVFPFLGGRYKAAERGQLGSTVKKLAGEGLGAGVELAPLTGALPAASAAQRIATGATVGASSGLATGLRQDESLEKTVGRAVTGATIGGAISGFAELLAKAGDKAADAWMRSAVNPYKKDLAKVERLVDDKTLSTRLNEMGLRPGTAKGMVKQLDSKLDIIGGQLDDIVKNVDDVVGVDDIMAGMDDVLDSTAIPQSAESKELIRKQIEKYKLLYKKEGEYSLVNALKEKRAIGADLGAKGFSPDPRVMRELSAEKIVQRKIYDNLKKAIEQKSGNPKLVAELNKEMSTLLDGRSLFLKAGTHGKKLLNQLATGGSAGAAYISTGTLASAGLAGGAAAGAMMYLRSTLGKTLNAAISRAIGQTLPSQAGQAIVNKVIDEVIQELNLNENQ